MKKNYVSLALLLAVVLVFGCRSSKTPAARENFEKFYDRFLTDSSFQMSRILFPLPGISSATAESETDSDTTYWTRDEWIMLKKPELDTTQFKRRLTVSDTLATDEIYMDDAGFYFKTVFEPVKRKWHLVYMVDSDM